MKTICWLLYLTLSLFIMPLNWLRNRVKHGPSPRLWLASDHELLAEVKKRGLAKRQRATAQTQAVVVQPEIQIDQIDGDAVKAVALLNCVPQIKARDAVIQAAKLFAKGGNKRPGTQELTVMALKLVG